MTQCLLPHTGEAVEPSGRETASTPRAPLPLFPRCWGIKNQHCTLNIINNPGREVERERGGGKGGICVCEARLSLPTGLLPCFSFANSGFRCDGSSKGFFVAHKFTQSQ
ncbi:hypothetical protein COCON_G00194760 [Conger conger]|uniref:Uncharacterized protein n=1 Tax=Conger conger TaxID=82655 RepID=A0A9Q1D1C0_CONCO|nr:hypothetical protein COCON_G00194760 [Conger conger]